MSYKQIALVGIFVVFLEFFIPLFVASPNQSLAEWSGTTYGPGTTLDPECTPGQANCNVTAPVAVSADPNAGLTVTSGEVKISDGGVTFAKLATNSCTNGQIPKFNGTDWVCGNDLVSSSDSLASGNIFVGNGSNVATAVTPFGDVTIDNAGVTTIGGDKITSSKILDGTIVSADLSNGSVTTTKIVDGNVTTIKVADGAITLNKLGSDSVNSAKIVDGSIATADIADGSVTTSKVVDANITTNKLADDAVTTAKITDSNVTTSKIADGAIVTLKLADSSVTSAKIVDGTIITTDLADGAVTTSKILDGTIANADINATAGIAWTKIDKTSSKFTDLGDAPTYTGNAGRVLTVNGTSDGLVWASGLTSSLASGNILVGNASNVATVTTLSGDATLSNTGALTITANAVALGTDTTGNYIASIANGGGIAVSGSGSENAGVTLALDIDGLTAISSINSTDTIPVSTATGLKKITQNDLFSGVLGALNYRGTWNATTNTPNLSSYCATGTKGHYYVVNTAGTTDLNGIASWNSNDWAVCNGTAWEKVETTNTVASVFGRVGTITAGIGDYTALQITNVPAGGISSTNVQNALNELDTKKLNTTAKLSNLDAPTYTGNAGKVLTVNGTSDGLVWASGLTSSLASGNIFVGNGSNVATAVTPSGDVTIDNAGVTTIGGDKITSSKIVDGTIVTVDLADDAVTNAKLADSSVNTMELVDGAVTTVKLAADAVTSAKILDGTISNADISGTAAIAWAKISKTGSKFTDLGDVPAYTGNTGKMLAVNGTEDALVYVNGMTNSLSSGQLWVGNASNVATGVAMSGDAIIANSGALTLATTAVSANSYGSLTNIPTFTVDSKGRLTAAGTVLASGITVAGDVSGTLGASSVDKLKGAGITIVSLASNNLLQYNGTNWVNITPASLGFISSIGTLNSQTKSANGAVIATNALVLQTADATNPGLVSTAAQTFAGNKTFSGNIAVNGGTINSTGALIINSTTTNALTLDSETTGAVNLGTSANAKTITIGNGTGATTINVNTGTSGMTFNSTATTSNTYTFNANSLTSGTGLKINANSLTTGTGLSLTSSYAAGNSTNGLLYVANTGAVTNGTIARIASNSTAGSGLTVLANGRVGIGTANPTNGALVIENMDNTTGLGPLVLNTGSGNLPTRYAGTILQMVGSENTTTRLEINSFGGSGSGLTLREANGTPAAPTTVVNGDTLGFLNASGYNGTTWLTTQRAGIGFYGAEDWNTTNNGTYMTFSTTQKTTSAAGEAMRITDAGNVGIGTTSPTSALTVSSAATGMAARFVNTSNTTNSPGISISAGSNGGTGSTMLIQFIRPDGTALGSISQASGSTVAYNTTSDQRLKQNITGTSYGVLDLMKINVRDFNYKNDPNGRKMNGFIAQELSKVYPDAVTVGSDEVDAKGNLTNPWSVDYGRLTPLIIKSIQDQQNQIATNSAMTEALDMRTKNVVATENGKTVFKGMIVADTIQANHIIGLDYATGAQLSDIDAALIKNGATLNAITSQIASMSAKLTDSSMSLKLNDLEAQGAVTFKGSAAFQGLAVFKALAEFMDKVIFHKDVEFDGVALFNNDTAGYAKILKGHDSVDVKFDKEYAAKPIINITVVGMHKNMNYALNNITTKGFTVQIDPTQDSDIEFNWSAVSVKDAKTQESVPTTPTVTPTIMPTTSVTVTPSINPTAVSTPTIAN